jgi:hypothetical protein
MMEYRVIWRAGECARHFSTLENAMKFVETLSDAAIFYKDEMIIAYSDRQWVDLR